VKVPAISPGKWLLAGACGCLIAAVLTVLGATRSPWLGLRLAPPAEGEAGVLVVSARGPSARIPSGAMLVSIAAEGGVPLALDRTDLVDEPDYFDRYEEMDAFFRR
jgi:hypothetical protein